MTICVFVYITVHMVAQTEMACFQWQLYLVTTSPN